MTKSDKASSALTAAEATRLRDAAVYAFCIGQPLNRFVSIHLGQLGISKPHPAITEFTKHAGEWIRRRSSTPAAYTWVLENPKLAYQQGGLHFHAALHVPHLHVRDFEKAKKGWLVGADGMLPKGAMHSQAVRHSAENGDVELYLRHGLLGMLRYMLKGMERGYAGDFGVAPAEQGAINGKRSGYSERLGVANRWVRTPWPKNPKVWLGGSDIRMRRLMLHLCPELLGMPPHTDCE